MRPEKTKGPTEVEPFATLGAAGPALPSLLRGGDRSRSAQCCENLLKPPGDKGKSLVLGVAQVSMLEDVGVIPNVLGMKHPPSRVVDVSRNADTETTNPHFNGLGFARLLPARKIADIFPLHVTSSAGAVRPRQVVT